MVMLSSFHFSDSRARYRSELQKSKGKVFALMNSTEQSLNALNIQVYSYNFFAAVS